ncbi:ArsB/NhaD family transporter [Acidaminobacter sp. JC074]|uniref:SLC13 family permease n=1 Tax=Acidaminobacter sp. JC074 TaxID=2530199 RepID=UPI001F1032D9|nr:ArsB/NhaD family transporter [Acidaminobacter sp. JC074]MCH4886161.1 ArsB/NhaD family transporter [Acidaminobacter sp. JC074]
MTLDHIILGIAIFSITYLLIVTERFNRVAVAMTGAALMMFMSVEAQEKAIEHIDFNTIGILIGMMIIVNITRRSGIFEYLAIKAVKVVDGRPWGILVLFLIITAVASALLDNVTTILLIAPITLVITDTLKLNPIPFLVPEILMANIGGTATLIGDPPNIMIGSATGITFMDFLVNLGPVVVVIFLVTLFLFKIIYKGCYTCEESARKEILALDENLAIKDQTLLKKSVVILFLTMVGFTMHGALGLESATIAISGAAILLFVSKQDPEDIFIEIEWNTIFFFVSLFVLVGGLEEVGALDYLADKLVHFTHGDIVLLTFIVLFVSAIASAFLDNIPFVATMIPLLTKLGAISGGDMTPVWWALSLGACLGGNGTLIGASANVIVSGMLEKKGFKLSFGQYMKIGFPLMMVSVLISAVYLGIFYI